MNCFVLMPFSPDLDDVHATIKQVVTDVLPPEQGRCFRLDDFRPAGRITDRLLAELRSATFCVADLTGTNPNVMWEYGFATALGKPTVLITQSLSGLPFDIKDMQALEYNRSRLTETLAKPLRRVLVDTISSIRTQEEAPEVRDDSPLVGTLLSEVAQLKQIIGEAVRTWSPKEAPVQVSGTYDGLVGHWINHESDSHVYSEIIDGELVSPYCFGGNGELTAVYYGWRRTGDHWFARFKWFNRSIAGFAFLRQVSLDALDGAWWYGETNERPPEGPPADQDGVPSRWERQPKGPMPTWATHFFEEVRREGFAARLARSWPKQP